MSLNWSIINSVAIFILTTTVALYLRKASAAAITAKDLEAWKSDIDKQLAVLGTQVSPLWAAVQSKIAKDLTHPHPQFREMDDLLRSLEDLTITDEERARLHLLLKERAVSTDTAVSDEERTSAKLMIGVMEKVLEEAANPAPVTDVVTVGTKNTGIEEKKGEVSK